MAATFIKAAQGYDIYSAGAVANNYPWNVYSGTGTANIVAGAGEFGGNALELYGTNTSNVNCLDLSIPSTAKLQRSASQSGIVSVNTWINVQTAINGLNAQTLFGLGSSASQGYSYPLVGLSTSAGAANLTFPTVFNQLSNAPFLFPISLTAYYFLSLRFAWYNSTIFGTYYINNVQVYSQQLSWTADNFAGTFLLDRLKFYGSSTAKIDYDDTIVQLVSNNDADWPVTTGNPTTSTIPGVPAAQIYNMTPTANGDTDQWVTSDNGTTPNWQAATDSTGSKYVRATDSNQTDLYKWTAPAQANGILGVVYTGTSAQSVNIQPQQKVGTTQTTMKRVQSGANRFIGISEDDGTNPWTVASIGAAQFGQESA